MKTIEIPRDWENLPKLIQAMIDVKLTIHHDTFAARVTECLRVDLACNPGGTGSPWTSQATRDNYLSAIIRGSINIGS